MTIRVWLIVFVLLFAGVELLEWIFELGSAQSGGYWTMLGGLGLAAASNAKHLPKIGNARAPDNMTEQLKTEQLKTEDSCAEPSAYQPKGQTSRSTDRSEESISFRVRLPWR